MLRTWMSTELPTETAGRFKEYCRDMHLKYEASEAGDLIHFEVKCSVTEAADADEFIDRFC